MCVCRRFVCLGSFLLLAPLAWGIPDTVRLFRLPVVRFVIDEHGGRWGQRGQLDSFGAFHLTDVHPVPEGITLPAEALDRNLIHEDAWLAYQRLGPEAVANFAVDDAGFIIPVGARWYAGVGVRKDARYDLGDLVNISARAIVTPGGEPLIGGFIIEHQARRVLIRGVGPSLARLGVTLPLANPYLEVYRQGSSTVVWYNDDWNQRYDANEIRQMTVAIGAFPLREGSRDAAYLLELPPGAYTAHVTTYSGTGGTVLLEVYILP